MEDILRCSICDSVDLDDSLGTFLCNRCKYTYVVFSDNKMRSIYEKTRRIRFEPMDDSMTRSYVNDILEYDPTNPFALYGKGCMALKRGFSYRAIRLFEKSHSILNDMTSLPATECTLKNLEISMVFEIQNHMIERIGNVSKRYSKNPNDDNRDLMLDVLDEIGGLFGYCTEHIGMKIPDILLLMVYDRLSSVALINLLKGIKKDFERLDGDDENCGVQDKAIDDIFKIMDMVYLFERYSHLDDSLMLIDAMQTIVLSWFRKKKEEGRGLDNLKSYDEDAISYKLFKISESNIRINKKLAYTDYKNDIKELMEGIHMIVLNDCESDFEKAKIRINGFGLILNDDLYDVISNDSPVRFDRDRWTYIESKKIDSSIMNPIRLPTWFF